MTGNSIHESRFTRRHRSVLFILLTLLLGVFLLTACGDETPQATKTGNKVIEPAGAKTTLRIISGSENKVLEPILEAFAAKEKINIIVDYKGSLDIMRLLESDVIDYDAVWPASSLWVSVGDTKHRVKDLESISMTPIIFGIRESLAKDLGFVGKEVHVRDILAAIESGKLRFTMTSATQSNSGAGAYIGFLYALLDNPDVITSEMLDDPELQTNVRTLLAGVERSSGSSDWLKDLFLAGGYDAMVNYEALIISANETLVARGEEPLYAVYPVDGMMIADSPLGFISENGISGRNETAQREAFLKLQEYLMKDDVQEKIQATGRRTGFAGVTKENREKVFKSEWGIDTDRIIATIKMPKAEVLFKALNLYQSELKKPGYNIYALDYSGSMSGRGRDQLVAALEQIMNKKNAEMNLIQASAEEVNVFYLFSSGIFRTYRATGPDELEALYASIKEERPTGGTAIFDTAIEALKEVETIDLNKYSPAIIIMSDGEDTSGTSIVKLEEFYRGMNLDVPIFSILFGSASEVDMERIAVLSTARSFDGRKDLIHAFQTVRGYN